jgi:hypothetical protein
MVASDLYHPCPICHQNFVSHWERYPLAVCQTGYGQVSDHQGRSLTFLTTLGWKASRKLTSPQPSNR